jgi:hypothetical protein
MQKIQLYASCIFSISQKYGATNFPGLGTTGLNKAIFKTEKRRRHYLSRYLNHILFALLKLMPFLKLY